MTTLWTGIFLIIIGLKSDKKKRQQLRRERLVHDIRMYNFMLRMYEDLLSLGDGRYEEEIQDIVAERDSLLGQLDE